MRGHLTAQDVEVLSGRGAVGHANIVFGAEQQEALHASAGVFGALAFITVRKKKGQAADLTPFLFGGGQELIDDDLCAVGKISELRFPQSESVRVRDAVAIFESDHAEFAERTVEHFKRCLIFRDELQGNVAVAVFVIVEREVALAESAATAILAAQAYRRSFENQAAEGDGFSKCPIDGTVGGESFAAFADEAFELGMEVESCGNCGDALNHLAENGARNGGGIIFRNGFDDGLKHPGARGFVGVEGGVQTVRDFLADSINIGGAEHFGFGETGTVLYGSRRKGTDLAVHDGLRVGRIIGFIVAVAAVADHVDHDVALEAFAVIEGQLHNAEGGFGIVAIDVEDGCLHHARDIGCVGGGAGMNRQGGEADLIVDDQMECAAGPVAIELRQVQRFGDNALACESGVAMDEQRDHFGAGSVAEAFLFRADHALDDGIYRFEVAGVGGQRYRDGVARG